MTILYGLSHEEWSLGNFLFMLSVPQDRWLSLQVTQYVQATVLPSERVGASPDLALSRLFGTAGTLSAG
jgi:hypothetical protein